MSVCEYCDGHRHIFSIEYIDELLWAWCHGEEKTLEEACDNKAKRAVFIDRGYIRLADPDDCSCLRHGELVKISYCPFCGDPLHD